MYSVFKCIFCISLSDILQQTFECRFCAVAFHSMYQLFTPKYIYHHFAYDAAGFFAVKWTVRAKYVAQSFIVFGNRVSVIKLRVRKLIFSEKVLDDVIVEYDHDEYGIRFTCALVMDLTAICKQCVSLVQMMLLSFAEYINRPLFDINKLAVIMPMQKSIIKNANRDLRTSDTPNLLKFLCSLLQNI